MQKNKVNSQFARISLDGTRVPVAGGVDEATEPLCDENGVLWVRIVGATPSGATFVQDFFTPTDLQTAFVLSAAADPLSILFIVNGVVYTAADGSISYAAGTVTWLDILFTLDTADEVVVYYVEA